MILGYQRWFFFRFEFWNRLQWWKRHWDQQIFQHQSTNLDPFTSDEEVFMGARDVLELQLWSLLKNLTDRCRQINPKNMLNKKRFQNFCPENRDWHRILYKLTRSVVQELCKKWILHKKKEANWYSSSWIEQFRPIWIKNISIDWSHYLRNSNKKIGNYA